jgi:hypothetical protein
MNEREAQTISHPLRLLASLGLCLPPLSAIGLWIASFAYWRLLYMDELIPIYLVVVGASLLSLIFSAICLIIRPKDRIAATVLVVNIGGLMINGCGCLSSIGGGAIG